MPVKMSSTDVAGNPPKAVPSLKGIQQSQKSTRHSNSYIQAPLLHPAPTLQSTLQSRINLEADQAMLNNDEHGERTVIL